MAIIAGLLMILGLYLYVKKPDYFVILFFTLTIADVNFSIPGLPLNARALLGIMAIIRVFTLPQLAGFQQFLASPARNIVYFIFYTLIVSMAYDLLTFDYIKTSALTFICAYLGYIYYDKTKDISFIRTSLILAGLICLGDLVYTYVFVGEFPVQRVYQRLMGVPLTYDALGNVVEPVNWNFYGCICGMTFLLVMTEYLYSHKSDIYSILMMPLMFMGVLMSTSRSSLLGIIGGTVMLIAIVIRSRRQTKRAYKLIVLGIGAIILSLFLFSIMQEALDLEVEFVQRITSRLIDEPIAVINKNLGYSYNAQELDALDWREEASKDGWLAFMDLRFIEQFFGIGFWGYAERNLGHNNLPPHNGIIMLLVEFGIAGTALWSFIFFRSLAQSFRVNNNTSALLVIVLFLFLYALGQNEILSQGLFFLVVSTLIAENQHLMREQMQDRKSTAGRNLKTKMRVSPT